MQTLKNMGLHRKNRLLFAFLSKASVLSDQSNLLFSCTLMNACICHPSPPPLHVFQQGCEGFFCVGRPPPPAPWFSRCSVCQVVCNPCHKVLVHLHHSELQGPPLGLDSVEGTGEVKEHDPYNAAAMACLTLAYMRSKVLSPLAFQVTSLKLVSVFDILMWLMRVSAGSPANY